MATFTNQATLTYRGGEASSNITVGELTGTLTLTKTAVSNGYRPDGTVTYIVTVTNNDTVPVTGLTLTDDLGAYSYDSGTVTPLSFVEGTLHCFLDGAPIEPPVEKAAEPFTLEGVTLPAGSTLLLVYETAVTVYAPPGGEITNTVTVTGPALTVPVTASATVQAAQGLDLSICKALSPQTVNGSGEITYTFTVRNSGSASASAEDVLSITDTFVPALSGLVAALNGTALAAPTDYTYDETTGIFATVPGVITVPAATFVQADDGSWSVLPGEAVLTVTGTI